MQAFSNSRGLTTCRGVAQAACAINNVQSTIIAELQSGIQGTGSVPTLTLLPRRACRSYVHALDSTGIYVGLCEPLSQILHGC
jgi:hypothetical protein